VHRLAVGHDHVLERKLEQRPQGGERPFLVPGCRPDPELAARCGQPVGEDEGALLRQPQRRLVPATPVIKGDEAAWKLVARPDRLELGLGDIGAPEKLRPERSGAVAANEEVDIANVIGLEDGDDRRWPRVEPGPDLPRVVRWRERVEERDLTAGLDAGLGDHLFPAQAGLPVGVLEPPDPEPGRDVA
jgi:hypothetical protein